MWSWKLLYYWVPEVSSEMIFSGHAEDDDVDYLFIYNICKDVHSSVRRAITRVRSALTLPIYNEMFYT